VDQKTLGAVHSLEDVLIVRNVFGHISSHQWQEAELPSTIHIRLGLQEVEANAFSYLTFSTDPASTKLCQDIIHVSGHRRDGLVATFMRHG
jgi:hypothetical protein